MTGNKSLREVERLSQRQLSKRLRVITDKEYPKDYNNLL